MPYQRIIHLQVIPYSTGLCPLYPSAATYVHQFAQSSVSWKGDGGTNDLQGKELCSFTAGRGAGSMEADAGPRLGQVCYW